MSEASDALYPPTVTPPASPLGAFAFLARCADNPLATIPAFAYTDLVTAIEPVRGYKVLWVCDPEWIERILVRDWEQYSKTELERRVFSPVVGDGVLSANGSNWRWQRRVLAPLFRHGEIARYVPDMIAAAEHCIEGWRVGGPSSTRAIDTDMMSVTFDVIVRTMLFGGAPRDVQAVMQSGSAYLDATPWEIGYGILGLPAWLPHPAKWRLARSARAMRRAVGAIIDDRRRQIAEGSGHGATSDDRGDLLGRLLAARDPETDAPLTQDQLVDNLATLLEAGHETTAKALTWSLYLLARAPEWQARVRAEVAAVAGSERLTAEHVERLAVTERVIKEAMRLYPPAPMLSRTPLAAVTIAGHEVIPGQQVLMPVFAIHRHRQLWSDPDRFDPDRFLPERERDVRRTQYLPFGAGPRICLGASFALVEAKALLATLVRGAHFEWDGKHLPEPQSRITLHPKGGMPLEVTVL